MIAGIWQIQSNHKVGEASVEEAFPFLNRKGNRISLVGAGGKTTLMHHLAEELRKAGKRVITTTTTHIMNPGSGNYIDASDDEFGSKIKLSLQNNNVVIVGHTAMDHKLSGLSNAELDELGSLCDCVLIEADGAKGMPIKIPSVREPVIYPQSNIIIGVIGIDAVGKSMTEACFRLTEAKALFKVADGHILTVEDCVTIALSEDGTYKGVENREFYLVINKCDNTEQQQLGAAMMEALLKTGKIPRSNMCMTSFITE